MKNKGIGDKLAKLTDSLGIKKCEGCEKRQEEINVAGHQVEFYIKKNKHKPFTTKYKKKWKTFLNRKNKEQIDTSQEDLIIKILKDVLNMSIGKCKSCDYKVYIKMINTIYNKTE